MTLVSHIERIYLKKISGTSHATAGTQTTHAHGEPKIPFFVLIVSKGNGVVYISAAADATNFYVKGSASAIAFDALLVFKR